ncbi:MAG: hypothetical protein JW891_16010 [Candidatus Lokiarchaeota archaeon]|nr:hypothetical protein [Candidatus Lokiarchaeota archaeon]
MEKKEVKIPVEQGICLRGSLYYSKETPLKAPFVINLSGLGEHRESEFVKYFSEKFAHEGFYVLTYDYRAHGETAKQTGKNITKNMPNIFRDVNKVISWIIEKQKNKLLDQKIALFGPISWRCDDSYKRNFR